MKLRLIALLAPLISVGCVDTSMRAVSSNGAPVTFKYARHVNSDIYFAQVGSEKFEGVGVAVGTQKTSGTIYTEDGPQHVELETKTGRFHANLRGNQGSELLCVMQYVDQNGKTSRGGEGLCLHTNKSKIRLAW